MNHSKIPLFCVAACWATGVAVETIISGQREAWDVGTYWTVGLPLMLAAALLFGFLARQWSAAIGYAPFAGQLAAMLFKTGVGSMIGPGVILLALFGTVGLGAARVAAAIARRLAPASA